MAKKEINVHLDLNEQELREAKFEQIAAPTFEGHEVFDVAGNRRHIQVNAVQETYAFLSDLTGTAGDLIVSGALSGTDLELTQADAGVITVDLSGLLDDTNLARVTSGALNGTDLELTRDDASVIAVDLSGLVGAVSQTVTAGNEIATYTPFGGAPVQVFETVTSLTAASNILTFTKEDGTTDTVDLSVYLDDSNLARLTSGSIDGAGLATFTRDDATSFTVDFSSLFDDTNLARITAAALNGTDLELDRDDATQIVADLSALDQSTGVAANTAAAAANAAAIAALDDNFVVSGALSGSDLVLTMDDASTVTIPLAGLLDDTNLPFINGGSVTGTDLTLTRDDASTVGPIDLSGLLDDTNLARVTTGVVSGTDIVLTRDDASTVVIDISSIIPTQEAAFERQTVNLAANTPLTITAANVTDIHSIQVYDAAGEMIDLRIAKGGVGANQRIIESNIAESGVVVEITGVA